MSLKRETPGVWSAFAGTTPGPRTLAPHGATCLSLEYIFALLDLRTMRRQFPQAMRRGIRAVCEDEQFVNWKANLGRPRQLAKRHKLVCAMTSPSRNWCRTAFAIGNAPLLVREADGCVLLDCVPLLTNEVVEHIRLLGGLRRLAVSHRIIRRSPDWSERRRRAGLSAWDIAPGSPAALHDRAVVRETRQLP